MPKLIVSIDGVVVKEVQLTKDRSTIGRRPYNDVVIDNLAVSGEHAVIQMASGSAILEDLGSTNGTYVNGKAVKQHTLADDDVIEVGKYKLKFQDREGLTSPGPLTGAAGFRSDGSIAHRQRPRASRARADRLCGRPRNGVDQGCHDHWQARPVRRIHHPPCPWV